MIFKFADLELDSGRRQLSRQHAPVKLSKLSFRLLEVLLEAAPNLVSHEDLVEKVWGPHRVVSPNSLSQRIAILRRNLGDNANTPAYIEGVRGEGYRLIPAVTVEPDDPGESGPNPVQMEEVRQRKPLPGWVPMATLVVVLAILMLTWPIGEIEYARRVDEAEEFRSVAVLPFVNLSPDDSHGYFAAGIHEEVINKLAKLTDLRVISRTSMLRYTDTREPIPTIARELAVDSMVEGSVRYAGGRIRVSVQLLDAARDVHMWSETYDRELKDIFKIETDIARDVAAAMYKVVSAEKEAGIATPPTTNLEAYAHYLQGRQGMVRRNPAELRAAVAHFKAAAELDSGFALAWVGVADGLDLMAAYSFIPLRETFDERQDAIDRALELNPLSGEPWLAFARLKDVQQQPDEAEKYYLKSIELNPGNAQAYHWYGFFLTRNGRPEEALPYLRSALDLDPVAPVVTNSLALVLRVLGRTEEALVTERKNIELNPRFINSYTNLMQMLSSTGHLDEAMYWASAAVAADRSDPGARITQCIALLNLGDDLAAEKCHERVTVDFPQATTLRFWPGLYIYREQYELMLQKMQEWNELDPNPIARLGLGYAYLNNRQVENARALFSEMWPEYFGTDEVTILGNELERVVLAGVTLMLNGEAPRANYLFDQALLKMASMHRSRGWGFDRADIAIHVFRDDRRLAIAALREAIDSGWRENWWRLRGPGFDSMNEEPEWLALNAELRADVARQRDNFLAHKDESAYWR